MEETGYSLPGIHLPENTDLVGRIKVIAQMICGLIILWSGIAFFWRGGGTTYTEAGMFIIAAGALLIRLTNETPKRWQLWLRLISIVCGCTLVGLSLFHLTRINIHFLLIGLTISLSRMKILYRFYIIQFLALVVVLVNLATVFGALNVYTLNFQNAVLLVLLGEAVVLRWPNRGFLEMFTADSLLSTFAFRMLMANILIIPPVVFMSLVLNQTAATLAVVLVSTNMIICWAGVKILNRFEVERFLSREALRVNEVGLKMSNDDLDRKMKELEQSKQKYAEALDYQKRFRDLADYVD